MCHFKDNKWIYYWELLIGGQGVCHGYHYQRNRTGGWHDLWCQHEVKVGSKMQACQETVSDPADLLLSMKKLPVLAVCDDACTLVQHIGHREGTIAWMAYGETQGCFEKPSFVEAPRTDIDCPAILPSAYNEQEVDSQAMTNPSPFVHPDTKDHRRFIMGTKMQMRGKGKSHKRPQCAFHDLDNCIQGKYVKSMSQETMQVTRKYKTIQQDKMRGFNTSYMANFLQDYFHNLKKAKDQERRFKKVAGFIGMERDSLTKRTCLVTKNV